MRNPHSHARSISALAFALVVTVPMIAATGALPGTDEDKNKAKPSVSVKANPAVGFAPMRVVMTAELKGGANDYAEYYCPTIEWQWGDDTRAESTADCDPYEAGKSEIKRRYVFDRVFQTGGEYRVEFRMKQKNKVVGSGSTTVRVGAGLRDGGGS